MATPQSIDLPVWGRVVSAERDAAGKRRWHSICPECGVSGIRRLENLRRTRRCRACALRGNSERIARQARTHGGASTREYSLWKGIVARCSNPKHKDYGTYAGMLCPAWQGSRGFETFLAEIGMAPSPQHTVDRVDNTRGYEPGNVRWATAAEQARNQTRNVWVKIAGERLCATDWEARYGLPAGIVARRVRAGWDPIAAVQTPARRARVSSSVRAVHASLLAAAVQRCHNPRDASYASYGGRGIYVDPAWRGRGAVDRFLAYLGPRPSPEHTLDRIDNDGPYAPGNVRWATRRQQQRNRRANVALTFRGETRLVCEWAEMLGLHPNVIACRLRKGWTHERTLSTPSRSASKHALVLPKTSTYTSTEHLDERRADATHQPGDQT